MTFYSNIVHFDPEGHQTYFSNTIYFMSDKKTRIEGSVNLTATAIMTVNADKIKVSSANLTATANITTKSHIIANANANIAGQPTLTTKSHIIANAKSNILAEAIIKARALRLIIPTGSYYITIDDYFTKDQPSNSDSVANYIIVETQPLAQKETEELFSTNEIRTIEAGETITINAEYSSKPAINCSASLTDNTANTSITNASYYACRAEIEITNNGTSQESFNLIIEGKPLEISGAEKAFAKDDRSITENGKIEYTLPKNHLIQTKEMAQIIADKLKDSFADPKRDVSLDWRGNPALILADPVSVPEFQKMGVNKIGQFYVTSQSFEYNGGLRADLEGRKNE